MLGSVLLAAATASATARNASGLNAAAHQRTGSRQQPIRVSRSRTPARPQSPAVTAKAARAGPSNAGKIVGQPSPLSIRSPAATNGNAHAHETAYASTTKDASAANRAVPALGSGGLAPSAPLPGVGFSPTRPPSLE